MKFLNSEWRCSAGCVTQQPNATFIRRGSEANRRADRGRKDYSMEYSPVHLLMVLVLVVSIVVGIPWLAYRHGKKVGDQAGYIRGYKEGQQSK